MVREIDVRTPDDRTDDARREALTRAAGRVSDSVLPDEHRVRVASFDPATGNPAVVVSDAAPPTEGDYVGRALRHLQRIGPALGITEDQAPEFVADPDEQVTSAGAVAVHLRQFFKSVPIYDATETVRFGADGAIVEVAGRTVTVDGDPSVDPRLTPEQALRIAATHVAEGSGDESPADPFGEPLVEPGLDLAGFAPVERTSGADRTDRPATFDAPPFDHVVTVALQWFPLDGGLRLAWHTKLAVPGGTVYRLLVDAGDGRVLLARRLTRAVAGRAEAVLTAGGARQQVPLPRPVGSYGAPVPADLPAGFPVDWLLDSSTRGASVTAVLAPGTAPVQGAVQGSSVVFAPPGANDQLVVNLFTLCSGMHDLLYLLGFREADGNFQVDNFGRGGRAADPVLARVHPGPVWGTANMGTPPDGSQPTMNMGLVSSTGRHTALDPDVVYHEYTHGLSNRLVGGARNDAALDAVQSGGMGEGWSDFFACVALGKTVVGDWVVDRPTGIREFRYDEQFPDDYGDLGTGRYVGDNVHDIGELWCATLMSLARRLDTWMAAQIVVDGLKLTAANPSFLAARDAILLAADQHARTRGDDDTARADLVHTVWDVFARYGMGPAARTAGANTLTGIVADFTAPPRPTTDATVRASAAPATPIPDADPAGVVSVVELPTSGRIVDVGVSVKVTHTYRGDLNVSLEAPDGTRVVLHDRTGGRTDNLVETWRSHQHAGLATLRGQPAGGRWAMHVADLARADVGTLDTWSIEAAVGESRRTVEAEATPGLAIPDDRPAGIRSDLQVAGEGTISGLTLDVDVTHTYVGDLEVTLLGPDGTTVAVHKRGGGAADNLIVSYTSSDGGPLAPFLGKPAAGTWSLQVADRAGRDVGKLNRWRLAVLL